jgi:branched-chain amino acid aminotransferase
MTYKFPVQRTTAPKAKPDPDTLEFGKVMTDHMFVIDYTPEQGWHDGRIVPYAPLSLEPAAMVFHYGQEMFEGLKAYKDTEGKVRLFRPDKNAERINNTNDRMCMPAIDPELVTEAVKAVVDADRDWIPTEPGTSLYIRPFVIATEPALGVRPSRTYKMIIILSPVGPYYKEGFGPTKIYVEEEYVRAATGGTGYAKIGGNYAASLKAQAKAAEKGYYQVLWLDGAERKYVEEIGTSNAFFVIGGEVITAPLSGTILPGVTRDSAITLLRRWGLTVSERKLSIAEVYEAQDKGMLDEIFATGTAAVVSPVGELCWQDRKLTVNGGKVGPIAQRLYDTITGIQCGAAEDTFGWTVTL